MPITSNSLFNTVSQEGVGPGSNTWSNLTNVLADAGTASVFYNPQDESNRMILNTPLFDVFPPAGSEINNLAVSIRAYIDSSNADFAFQEVQIAGGTNRTSAIITQTPATLILSGDLAYWGITNQQALDYAGGLENLTFYANNPIGSLGVTLHVEWVRTQIQYGSSHVKLPGIF